MFKSWLNIFLGFLIILLIMCLSNFFIWFSGKIFLYYVNAYTDSRLAIELENEDEENNSERSKELRRGASYRKLSIFSIIYCEYCWNGLFDYFYGRLFKLFLIFFRKKKILKRMNGCLSDYRTRIGNKKRPYSKFMFCRCIPGFAIVYNLLYPLISTFLCGRMPNTKKALRTKKVSRLPPKREIVQGLMFVQSLNIKNNTLIIRKLKEIMELNLEDVDISKENEKIRIIFEFASKFNKKNRVIILNSICDTLNAASWWDKIFTVALMMRFCVFPRFRFSFPF